MKTIRAIIVDDEPLALRGLGLRLAAHEDIEIVGQCRNGREAIKSVKRLRPDLMLLDIQMPGLDGFQVLKGLVGGYMPLTIFVTAFDQYALDAFEAHALDYLLKPVEEQRLADALDRVRKRLGERTAMEQNASLLSLVKSLGGDDGQAESLTAVPAQNARYENRLNIKDRGQITCVSVDSIEWIDAAGDYMCIHANGETHILRETMKSLESRLDPAHFRRVHRSAIVNLNRVAEVHPYTNGECILVLEGGTEIKVSRSHRDVVTRFL